MFTSVQEGLRPHKEAIERSMTEFHVIPPQVPWKVRAKLMNQRERVLFKYHWYWFVIGLVAQYFHSVGTSIVFYLYEPRPRLRDLLFDIIPETSSELKVTSEVLMFSMVGISALYLGIGFFLPMHRPFYATIIFSRYIRAFSLCLVLRVMSFVFTVIPSPAPHCQPGGEGYSPPTTVGRIFGRVDPFNGCGDLIFSGHTLTALITVVAVQWYARHRALKVLLWIMMIAMSIFVLSARKHYTVDVIVAYYTVPMVWLVFWHYVPDYYPPDLNAVVQSQRAEMDRYTQGNQSSSFSDLTDPLHTTKIDLENQDQIQHQQQQNHTILSQVLKPTPYSPVRTSANGYSMQQQQQQQVYAKGTESNKTPTRAQLPSTQLDLELSPTNYQQQQQQQSNRTIDSEPQTQQEQQQQKAMKQEDAVIQILSHLEVDDNGTAISMHQYQNQNHHNNTQEQHHVEDDETLPEVTEKTPLSTRIINNL